MSDFDVAIIGLGGMGSAAAWQVARRGYRVVGFEQFGVAHDRGSSHGESRMVRQAYYEDPRYVPWLLRSYQLWDELAEVTGAPTLVRTGGLMIGAADSAVVQGTLHSAQSWSIAHEVLDRTEITRRFPSFALAPNELAVYEPGAGFVRPEATVSAHVQLAEAAGATLHFNTAVTGWEVGSRGVSVTTAHGVTQVDRLIVTAGPWAASLLSDLGIALRVERHVMHWMTPKGNVESFALGHHPVYLWECANGSEFYGFPALDGEKAAKVAFFHDGRPTSPDQVDRSVVASEAEPLMEELVSRIPNLPGTWVTGRACLYTMSPDNHFVIGTVPETEDRVSVAAGFSGHGFKFAPVVGQVLADLATTGSTDLDLTLFSPSRFH
jgi:sarcosine oxidase